MAVSLMLTQSGSGSTVIHAQSGDTITIALASTVEDSVLASGIANLQGLIGPTGVTFAIDKTGDAS